MKNGVLIVNRYLKSDKFDTIYQFLKNSAVKNKSDLTVLDNAEALSLLDEGGVLLDYVIFWDKDTNLANLLEKKGYRVFNNANSIKICDDKGLTYQNLLGEVNMPNTIIAPKTFENIGYKGDCFHLNYVEKMLGFPLVIKENFGSFGEQVYLANNLEELKNIAEKIGSKPHLFQKYIKTSFGRDVRIQVVGQKVVASVLRIGQEGDFRANVTRGGVMKAFNPPQSFVDMALKASKTLDLDFCGVDILFGENDTPILCEINSNAQFKNLLDATNINVADEILEYILGEI